MNLTLMIFEKLKETCNSERSSGPAKMITEFPRDILFVAKPFMNTFDWMRFLCCIPSFEEMARDELRTFFECTPIKRSSRVYDLLTTHLMRHGVNDRLIQHAVLFGKLMDMGSTTAVKRLVSEVIYFIRYDASDWVPEDVYLRDDDICIVFRNTESQVVVRYSTNLYPFVPPVFGKMTFREIIPFTWSPAMIMTRKPGTDVVGYPADWFIRCLELSSVQN